MGYTKRAKTRFNDHSDITDFWPDDTDTKIYLETCLTRTMQEIMEIISIKWPGASMEDIEIESEKIHTRCIYYDLHDSGDWSNFLVLTNTKKA